MLFSTEVDVDVVEIVYYCYIVELLIVYSEQAATQIIVTDVHIGLYDDDVFFIINRLFVLSGLRCWLATVRACVQNEMHSTRQRMRDASKI